MISDEPFPRPPSETIQSAWTELFSDPLLSLSRLRAAGLSNAGLGEAASDGGIVLRSIYWRSYHGLLPPPTSLDLFPPALQTSRQSYSSLRRRYLIAPDGRWADDCSPPDDPALSSSSSKTPPVPPSMPSTAGGWDPLSLDEESPWKSWYAQLDLRKTILQDVERTFPDIPYFTIERVKKSSITILFLFAMLNPDVGYRQGMHELLAVCLMTVDRDSLVNKESDKGKAPLGSPNASKKWEEALHATLDRSFVEHDAFELFNAIMKSAKAFYEWRSEEGPRSKITSPVVRAPIIARCHNLQSNLIRRIDPQLWERFETEGVEVQIWAILIFTRELPFSLALKLWDGIFAEDPGLQIIDYICLAMLLLIRNELLDADHSGLLTNLLRYPSPSATYPFSPFLILSQALLLRNSITPATGVEVVIQNQEVLGVKAQPPDRPPEAQHFPRGQSSMRGKPPAVKGYQGIAAGLFERAQAAGFDKAIMSTVADIRRNIPDSAYSYLPNLPFSPVLSGREPSGSFSSIPNLSALPRQNQYNSSPHPNSNPITQSASTDSIASIKSLRDAERELAELRLAMVGMGKAMCDWLDRLPADTGEVEKRGLGKIKDTLLDAAGKEVDEIVKEWGWHEGLETRSREPTPGPEEEEPVEVNVETKDGIAVGEITPTPKAVEKLQPPTDLPSPGLRSAPPASRPRSAVPEAGSGSGPGAATSGRLPLYLSSRDDRPISGLPRTPVTAPAASTQQRRPLSADESASASRKADLKQKEKGTKQAEETDGEGDPLAGLGVRAVPENGRRPVTGGRGVDPLLGMGVR